MKHLPTLLASLSVTALALSACTSASDLPTAQGSSGAPGQAAIPVYDVSQIAEQPQISSLLPESVKADGVLTIGAATDYAPAEFLSPDGQAVGYDVDLARALGKVLGLKVEVVTAQFDSIIPAVGTKYDLGISSFTITPERTSSATMVSYINVGSQFNVAKGNPKQVDVSDTTNLCGLTIGVQTGTAQETALAGYDQDCASAGKAPIEVKSYSDHSDAATALAGGSLDAVFADSTVAGYAQVQTGGAVEVVGQVFGAEPQGIVVSQEDKATAEAVRQAMQHLMDEGVWEQILTTWGVEASANVSTATVSPAQ